MMDNSPLHTKYQSHFSPLIEDFTHIEEVFAPQIVLILCRTGKGRVCDEYLSGTDKELIWQNKNMRLFKSESGALIFNMPHPRGMIRNKVDFYVREPLEQLRQANLLPVNQ